jgi:glutathione S-transferase
MNVKKVVWCAQELGLPFERINIDSFVPITTPGFLRLNPNGLIPVIDDAGFVLWESNAIVRYLATKYGEGSLSPTDLQIRADADRWMDWQSTMLYPSLVPAFRNLIRTPPDSRDLQAIEAARTKTETLTHILDQQLANREYLTGTGFTMADIVVACNIHNWLNLPLPRENRPHLQRWYAKIRVRPACATVLTLPLI